MYIQLTKGQLHSKGASTPPSFALMRAMNAFQSFDAIFIRLLFVN